MNNRVNIKNIKHSRLWMLLSALLVVAVLTTLIIIIPKSHAAYSLTINVCDNITPSGDYLVVNGSKGFVELSHVNPSEYYNKDLKVIITSNDSEYYNLTQVVNGLSFDGLGNETYPYEGHIYYAPGSENAIVSNHVLFNYISTKAELHNDGLIIIPAFGNNVNVLADTVVDGSTSADWKVVYVSQDDITTYSSASLVGVVDEGAELVLTLELDSSLNAKTLNIVNSSNAALFFGEISEDADATAVIDNHVLPKASIQSQANAGLFAGKVEGTLTVDNIPDVVNNISVTGKDTAGAFVGRLADDATLIIDVTDDLGDDGATISVNVQTNGVNGSSGGLVGYMEEGSELSLDEGDWVINGQISASGTNSSVGGLVGTFENATIDFDDVDTITISATISSSGSTNDKYGCGGCFGSAVLASSISFDLSDIVVNNTTFSGSGASYVGGLIGALRVTGNGTVVNISSSSSSHKTISTSASGINTTGSYGGLIGYYKSEDLSTSFNVNGISVNSSFNGGAVSSKIYGGVIATLNNDKAYIDIEDVSVSTNIAHSSYDGNSTTYYGGIVAKAENTTSGVYGMLNIHGDNSIVSSTSLASGLSMNSGVNYGALVGVTNNLVVRLSGTTDVSNAWPFKEGPGERHTALLVGNNARGLVYALGNGSNSDWTLVRPDSSSKKYEYSDLGEYGEVIRMTSSMSESDLFTFNSSAHTLTLNAFSYNLGSVVDFAKYSIAADCTPVDNSGVLRINSSFSQSANIQITNDIDLTGTGLTSLLHTKCYNGTLNGNNHTITLATGEVYGTNVGGDVSCGRIYYQEKVGLFAEVGYKVNNLNIDGYLDTFGVEYGGSLAAMLSGSNVEISDCNISTTFNAAYVNSSYSVSKGNWKNYVGGVIGFAKNISSLSFKDITLLNDLIITNPGNATAGVGGLLANTLENDDVTLSGIVVNGATLDTTDSSTKDLTFGGLVYKATKRLHVVKNASDVGVKFSGTASTISGNSTASETSSLIVCQGSELYFILDNEALSVDTQPTITIPSGSYFDELVGNSVSSGKNGIVSIETDDTGNLDKNSLSSYTHFLTNMYNNPKTRYYYDLYDICGNNGHSFATNRVVMNAEDMMAFDAWCYAGTSIKNYFVANGNGSWSIGNGSTEATIDLSGYSYYPIDVNFGININKIKIKLDYDLYNTVEASNRLPSNNLRQHYMMHSSLFYDVNSSMTINKLSLEGSAGYISQSGALIQHAVRGSETNKVTIDIKDLTLDDITIVYPSVSVPAYAPLLINKIDSFSVLSIDGLTCTNYDVTGEIASSLIGDVGNTTDGKKISLSFVNIELDSRTYSSPAQQWGGGYEYNAGGTYVGPLFTKATLLNAFYYYDAMSCRGVYNFNEEDPIVTYGKEISYTSSGREQYWFYDTYNEGTIVWDKTKSASNDNSDEETYFLVGYLPYVYIVQDTTTKTLDLRVNQGSNASASGCGTYGHPYVVTANNVDFIYSVAEFLNADDISSLSISSIIVNKTVLDAGKFVSDNYHTSAGSDDITLKLQTGTWSVIGGSYTISNQNSLTTKVKRYLANAYYQFDGSNGPIVITVGGDNEFYGLGGPSAKLENNGPIAFAGVLIGSDQIDGTNITINLNNASEKQFGGLIKFSNGAVIKDLNIIYTGTYTIDVGDSFAPTAASPDYSFFGGVIGYTIGGDNIIDNVMVDFSSSTIIVADRDNANYTNVGGYAGLVGGVISEVRTHVGYTAGGGIVFRNMASAVGLNSLTYKGNSVDVTLEYSSSATQNYLYWNPYVGRVYDGYACYDAMVAGTGTSTVATLNNTNKNYYIPTIYNTSTPSISLEALPGYSNYTTINWTIENEQGMWLASAILNSGAGINNLTYGRVNGVYMTYPYVDWEPAPDAAFLLGKARSTRSTYNYVGQSLTPEQIEDECYNEKNWSSGIGSDATHFGWAQVSYLVDKTGGGDLVSTMGYSTQNSTKTYNFYLASNMNMTTYKSGFRGIGHSYSNDGVMDAQTNQRLTSYRRLIVFDYFGSGVNNEPSDTIRTITMDMERHEYETEMFYTYGVALLPSLSVKDIYRTTYTINAIKLTGRVVFTTWDFTGERNSQIGEVGPSQEAHTAVGGLFAKYTMAFNAGKNTLSYTNVHLENLTIKGGFFTGGLGAAAIGYRSQMFGNGSHTQTWNANKRVLMEDCSFNNIYISSHGFGGGLFGVISSADTYNNESSCISNCVFQNSTIESDFSTPFLRTDKLFWIKYDGAGQGAILSDGCGGLFGGILSSDPIEIRDTLVDNLTVQATTEDATSPNLLNRGDSLGGICGVMGWSSKLYSLYVIDSTVSNCVIGHAQVGTGGGATQLVANSAGGIAGDIGAAGLKVENATIDNNIIRWAVNLGGVVAYYEWGANPGKLVIIDGVTITNNQIYCDVDMFNALPNPDQYTPWKAKNYVGGVIGGAYWSKPEIQHVYLSNNKIIGCRVAGVCGSYYANGSMEVSDVYIDGDIYALMWDNTNAWNDVKAAAIIGYQYNSNTKTVDVYNIYLNNVLIGMLLNNNGTICKSISPSFMDDIDEYNIGIKNGSVLPYPTLATQNKLTIAYANADTGNVAAIICGYSKTALTEVKVTGLYIHSDDNYVPYGFAYDGTGRISGDKLKVVYADYSGLRDDTNTSDYAGVDINPKIELPGIDLYGNFIGNEFANIYRDSNSSSAPGNYFNCYYNTTNLTFTVDSTSYNVFTYFNQASADASGALKKFYFTTYHTQETATNVPSSCDFPVLVISSEATNAEVNDVLTKLIRTLENTNNVLGTVNLITYTYNTSTGEFEVSGSTIADENDIINLGNNSLVYESSSFKLRENNYNTNTSSFMLLRISFTDPCDSSNHMYIDIPIIVSKMMNFYANLRILNGTSYIPVDYVGVTTMMVSDHGDAFTVFLEYNYQRDIENWNADIDSGVSLLWNYEKDIFLGTGGLPEDTQFVLVDVTKGGQAYYYTATDDIPYLNFTSFRTSMSGGTAWAKTPISEMLGLVVTENTSHGKYDTTDDPSEATIRVNGQYYKYMEDEDGDYDITMPSTSLNSDGYLKNAERYYVTIRTPSDESSTINNLMGYGTSTAITPLAGTGCIATKADKTNENFNGTYRYILTNSFSQEADIRTTNGTEDVSDQSAILAKLECIIPAIENISEFNTYHDYTAGSVDMVQEFTLSLLDYNASGVSKPCLITANSISWKYKLYYTSDDTDVEITTAAELVARALANGNVLTTAAAQDIIDTLNTTNEDTLGGAIANYSIMYQGFGDILSAIGKLGFKLVAEVSLNYDDAAKQAQFPVRVVSNDSDQSGIGVTSWSKIAYSLESLSSTGFAIGASDSSNGGNGKHFYLPADEENNSNAKLQMNVQDVQILSGNGFEEEHFDISANGVYDYSMIDPDTLANAKYIRYSVSILSKDTDSDRITPAYSIVDDPETYLTSDGMTITHGEDSENGFTATFDFETVAIATDTVEISCSPITGDAFEALGYQYGNYRIQLKAELLDASENTIASTSASDYIVYTNAIIATVIPQ